MLVTIGIVWFLMSLGMLLGLAWAMRRRTVVQSHEAMMADHDVPFLHDAEAIEARLSEEKIALAMPHA